MTGTVEWPVLIWIAGALGGALVTGGLFVWRVSGIVRKALLDVEARVMVAVAALQARQDLFDKELQDLKQHIVEAYAQKDDLREFRKEISRGFDELKVMLNRHGDRIDRIMDRRPRPRAES